MLALYLIAAHLAGDFLLQTRWQAADKLTDHGARVRHVTAYCVPFVPVAFLAAPWTGAVFFLECLWILHFATDSRRFYSTLGDWIAWNIGGAAPPTEKRGIYAAMGAPLDEFRLPPNPWPPIPILIDQSLHMIQLAVLGGLLLA